MALIPALILAAAAASGCKAQPRNAPLLVENVTFFGFSVSGTAPDFVTTVATGEVIAGTVSIFDYDGDTVTMTAAITGGSLTAAQAGLTTTFPLTVTAGMIVEFEIEGTAQTAGTVEITVTADDGIHDAITFRLTLNIVQDAAVVFVTQPPATMTTGEPFASPGVQVSVRGPLGNMIVGQSIAIKLTPGADTPALVGTTTATTDPLTGIATFDAVYLTKAGTNYTLVAAVVNGPNFTPATSTPFAVMPVAPAQIVFATQPTTTKLGVPLGPILVHLLDSFGNLATNADTDITLEFGVNPSNATLLGTTTRSAVDGVATFDNVRPDLRGVGYTLIARMSAGAATATSAAFSVVGLPAQLVFLTQPSTTTVGMTITPAVQVGLVDSAGHPHHGVYRHDPAYPRSKSERRIPAVSVCRCGHRNIFHAQHFHGRRRFNHHRQSD